MAFGILLIALAGVAWYLSSSNRFRSTCRQCMKGRPGIGVRTRASLAQRPPRRDT